LSNANFAAAEQENTARKPGARTKYTDAQRVSIKPAIPRRWVTSCKPIAPCYAARHHLSGKLPIRGSTTVAVDPFYFFSLDANHPVVEGVCPPWSCQADVTSSIPF
jgi:hypothetical protein